MSHTPFISAIYDKNIQTMKDTIFGGIVLYWMERRTVMVIMDKSECIKNTHNMGIDNTRFDLQPK